MWMICFAITSMFFRPLLYTNFLSLNDKELVIVSALIPAHVFPDYVFITLLLKQCHQVYMIGEHA